MHRSELRGPDSQSVDMRHFEAGGWPLSQVADQDRRQMTANLEIDL
jgi:hypothetical protein